MEKSNSNDAVIEACEQIAEHRKEVGELIVQSFRQIEHLQKQAEGLAELSGLAASLSMDKRRELAKVLAEGTYGYGDSHVRWCDSLRRLGLSKRAVDQIRPAFVLSDEEIREREQAQGILREPGRYHLAVSNAQSYPYCDQAGEHAISFDVLAGTPGHSPQTPLGSQAGKCHKECFFLESERDQKQLRRLAYITGLITREQLDQEADVAGLDFEKAIGIQLFADIEQLADIEQHEGGVRIGFLSMYSADDPEVGAAPRDPMAFALTSGVCLPGRSLPQWRVNNTASLRQPEPAASA